MVQQEVVTKQLHQIGAKLPFWNKSELRELPKILFEGEQMKHVCSGRYEGGFCILVATDQRVLLIDKKPFYLTLEDIRYERITDVQLMHRLLDATIRLGALTKNLFFTSYSPQKLRDATSFMQEQVMISRQLRQSAYQPQPLAPEPVQALLEQSPVQNPYRSSAPIMFRRRISRYY